MRANRFCHHAVASTVLACACLTGIFPLCAEQSTISVRAAAALISPVTLELNDVPLKEAVETLAKQAGVSVIWDDEELAKMDLPGEETVALQASQKMQLQKALGLVLLNVGLNFEDQGDSIYVTSRQAFDNRVVKACYKVSNKNYSNADLSEMISTRIAKGSWQSDHPDQPGYMIIKEGFLHVTHQRNVQASIRILLGLLSAQSQSQ